MLAADFASPPALSRTLIVTSKLLFVLVSILSAFSASPLALLTIFIASSKLLFVHSSI